MSEADLVAEVRRRHECRLDSVNKCRECNRFLPCDAIQLADAYEQLQYEKEADVIRDAETIERLQKNYDLAASVVAELTKQETEEGKVRLCTEIERLWEALEFYQDLKNYNTDGAPGHHGLERTSAQFGCDLGEIARAALHKDGGSLPRSSEAGDEL